MPPAPWVQEGASRSPICYWGIGHRDLRLGCAGKSSSAGCLRLGRGFTPRMVSSGSGETELVGAILAAVKNSAFHIPPAAESSLC